MTRIIVSNRLDKTYQYRKVEVTWTTVRGKELCQIAAYTEKQVFQENVDVEELADKLLVHFRSMCQMNIFTKKKNIVFKIEERQTADERNQTSGKTVGNIKTGEDKRQRCRHWQIR